tara:strand:- start:1733 stop:2269 length:537 start_codon:yes stop_codon:yes gene_type:complete
VRIINGFLKNKKISSKTRARPTMSKVRESIFQILDCMEGKSILDLFAGTGMLSFEAISRGASSALMVDIDKRAVIDTINNAKRLGVEDRVMCYSNKAEIAIRILSKKGSTFDFIFIDPPYFYKNYESLLKEIEQSNLLSPEGTLVIEKHKSVDILLSAFVCEKEKRFGSTSVMFLKKI